MSARFDADNPLRQTFAAQLFPLYRDMLDNLCRAMLAAHDEARLGEHIDVSDMARDLAAAAADLRYLAGWLAWSGSREDFETRWEHRLMDRAECLAPKVSELADELAAAVEAAVNKGGEG